MSILKKGKGGKVEDYRGVMLTQMAYKVYAAVLTERLREEVENRGFYHRVKQALGKEWE